MTDDLLARLARANPVPDAVPAPPISRVESLIGERSGERPPARRAHQRAARLLVPGLGAVATLAVVVAALVLVGHGTRPRAHALGPSLSPSLGPPATAGRVVLPRSGMRGVVQIWGASFSPGGTAVIGFEQCQPCAGTQRFAEWLVTSRDGGASWAVHRSPFTLIEPQFAGPRDGWSDGFDRGNLVNGVFRSHDGGLSWQRASLPVATNEPGDVSVAGGETWATGLECAAQCTTTILHGAATGSTLTATAAQPAARASTAQVVAAGAGSAYLLLPVGRSGRLYVTHDDGRSWQTTSMSCTSGFADSALSADGPLSLWEQCPAGHGRFVIARSSDGGRHWERFPLPVAGLYELRPVSTEVAWAVSDRGVVIRTEDGGASWRVVLRTGQFVTLFVRDGAHAGVVYPAGRGHVEHHAARTNLVVYRTEDSGRSWRPGVIALPGG